MNLELIQMKAELLKALAHPARLAVIELLAGGERCVCELQTEIEIEQSNLSQHLALLRKQGIVDCYKDGVKVIYRICYPQVLLIHSLAGDMAADRLTRDSIAVREAKEKKCSMECSAMTCNEKERG